MDAPDRSGNSEIKPNRPLGAPMRAGIVERIRRAKSLAEIEDLLQESKRMPSMSAKTQKQVLRTAQVMIASFEKEKSA